MRTAISGEHQQKQNWNWGPDSRQGSIHTKRALNLRTAPCVHTLSGLAAAGIARGLRQSQGSLSSLPTCLTYSGEQDRTRRPGQDNEMRAPVSCAARAEPSLCPGDTHARQPRHRRPRLRVSTVEIAQPPCSTQVLRKHSRNTTWRRCRTAWQGKPSLPAVGVAVVGCLSLKALYLGGKKH